MDAVMQDDVLRVLRDGGAHLLAGFDAGLLARRTDVVRLPDGRYVRPLTCLLGRVLVMPAAPAGLLAGPDVALLSLRFPGWARIPLRAGRRQGWAEVVPGEDWRLVLPEWSWPLAARMGTSDPDKPWWALTVGREGLQVTAAGTDRAAARRLRAATRPHVRRLAAGWPLPAAQLALLSEDPLLLREPAAPLSTIEPGGPAVAPVAEGCGGAR